MTAIRIQTLTGAAVTPHLPAVAALRIAVFREWPYRYAGDAAYEAAYLATYARSPHSLFVLALDGDSVVGASTAIPLADETQAVQLPFLERGLEPRQVFYFGESVVLPAFRGRGLGHAFFDQREAHARALGGFSLAAFCAVERAPDDRRRPSGHRDNDAFWRKRGYQPQDGMVCVLDWPEIDDAQSSSHRLTVWLRSLALPA